MIRIEVPRSTRIQIEPDGRWIRQALRETQELRQEYWHETEKPYWTDAPSGHERPWSHRKSPAFRAIRVLREVWPRDMDPQEAVDRVAAWVTLNGGWEAHLPTDMTEDDLLEDLFKNFPKVNRAKTPYKAAARQSVSRPKQVAEEYQWGNKGTSILFVNFVLQLLELGADDPAARTVRINQELAAEALTVGWGRPVYQTTVSNLLSNATTKGWVRESQAYRQGKCARTYQVATVEEGEDGIAPGKFMARPFGKEEKKKKEEDERSSYRSCVARSPRFSASGEAQE